MVSYDSGLRTSWCSYLHVLIRSPVCLCTMCTTKSLNPTTRNPIGKNPRGLLSPRTTSSARARRGSAQPAASSAASSASDRASKPEDVSCDRSQQVRMPSRKLRFLQISYPILIQTLDSEKPEMYGSPLLLSSKLLHERRRHPRLCRPYHI